MERRRPRQAHGNLGGGSIGIGSVDGSDAFALGTMFSEVKGQQLRSGLQPPLDQALYGYRTLGRRTAMQTLLPPTHSQPGRSGGLHQWPSGRQAGSGPPWAPWFNPSGLAGDRLGAQGSRGRRRF
jgi:hypothetical protein